MEVKQIYHPLRRRSAVSCSGCAAHDAVVGISPGIAGVYGSERILITTDCIRYTAARDSLGVRHEPSSFNHCFGSRHCFNHSRGPWLRPGLRFQHPEPVDAGRRRHGGREHCPTAKRGLRDLRQPGDVDPIQRDGVHHGRRLGRRLSDGFQRRLGQRRNALQRHVADSRLRRPSGRCHAGLRCQWQGGDFRHGPFELERCGGGVPRTGARHHSQQLHRRIPGAGPHFRPWRATNGSIVRRCVGHARHRVRAVRLSGEFIRQQCNGQCLRAPRYGCAQTTR